MKFGFRIYSVGLLLSLCVLSLRAEELRLLDQPLVVGDFNDLMNAEKQMLRGGDGASAGRFAQAIDQIDAYTQFDFASSVPKDEAHRLLVALVNGRTPRQIIVLGFVFQLERMRLAIASSKAKEASGEIKDKNLEKIRNDLAVWKENEATNVIRHYINQKSNWGSRAKWHKVYAESLRIFFDSHAVDVRVREELLNEAVDLALDDEDILRAGLQQGATRESITKARDERIAEFHQKAISLLGPDQGQAFIEYSSATAYVPIAQDFASRCAEQGHPLADPAMVAVVIDLARNLDLSDSTASPDLASKATTLALEQARVVLSPDQLRIFEQFLAEHPKPKY